MDKGFMEAVYQSLQGERIEPVKGVKNAFTDGSVCDKNYEEMLAAYQRLRERLNAGEEDPDVEIIIDSMMRITDHLCYEMFAYGWRFAKEER